MTVTVKQASIKKIPKLRFPKFSGDWNEGTLGDVCIILKGKGLAKDDITENGSNKCIRYGELYTEYRETINYVKSRTNISRTESLLSKKNDVLIPSSGETALDIARSSCVKEDDIILGGDLNVLRLIEGQNGDFFAYYLSNFQNKNIAKIAQGHSVVHLYASQLKNLKIKIPSAQEQQEIASCLMLTSEWIKNLQTHKELLESYQRGIMQKIFTQEIRFRDDDGNNFPMWNNRILGEVLRIGSGKDYKHLERGNIPVFGTGGYMFSVNKSLYSGETVFIGRKGTIDKPFYYNGDFWTVDTLFYTHSFKGITPKFTSYIFQKINWQKYNEASGVPSLSRATIEKIKINLPSLHEQQKITNFLESADNLIELKSQQIIHAEQWKKGLLQSLLI
ncbi:MAG: restriction endonuclease subunit S [Candidatus Peregrinibacteria bacterium]|nr:restriction endonuclease subunit S [Candidatus Peregrinibacteria bacterium]